MTNKIKNRMVSLLLVVITVLSMIPTCVTNAATGYNGGGGAQTVENMNVYSDAACTSKKGSLYDNEAFTVLYGYGNGLYYIEYSTPSGSKEGYISLGQHDYINDYTNNTCVATVNVNTYVYYGNNATTYVRAGTVYTSERVVVYSRYADWSYIEYNTSTGRKRGYVPASSLTYYNEPAVYEDFYLDNLGTTKWISGYYDVYTGLSYRFDKAGSVRDESVVVRATVATDLEGGYADFIEYNVAGTNQKKTGFIFYNIYN